MTVGVCKRSRELRLLRYLDNSFQPKNILGHVGGHMTQFYRLLMGLLTGDTR
jgi:hypothetical protein